jgi:hypothetical protein
MLQAQCVILGKNNKQQAIVEKKNHLFFDTTRPSIILFLHVFLALVKFSPSRCLAEKKH